MTEEGTVTRIEGKKAWVLTIRGTACESCDGRSFCMPFGGDGKKMEIAALNTVNARVGNIVNISLRSSSVMKAAFFVYMVPIIMLFIGVFTGNWMAFKLNYDKETCSLITGFLAFSASFLIVKLVSKWLSKKREFIPEITKIIG